MSTAIRLEHVSKRFTLHYRRPRSFQDLVVGLFHNRDAIPARLDNEPNEDLWALRDVSFSVREGETVGIVGPNGAGKSTLLKLITRIIEPTSGQIDVNGRVGALLELGAGFHPDLTGRENIYLNGSILGLSRSEIGDREHEIISFAELERFIDMPVRHYSSGMRMRLGFSVAAHTDPNILLVDEVLAVGDENFQHKCLDRIMDMRRDGVTICFVSHGLGQVRRLCSRAIWLDEGTVRAEGDVDDVVSAYLCYAAAEEDRRIEEAMAAAERPIGAKKARRDRSGRPASDRPLEIGHVSLLDATGNERHVFQVGEPWTVRVGYRCLEQIERPVIRLHVHRNDGLHVCSVESGSAPDRPLAEGEGYALFRVPELPLLEGTYFASAAMLDASTGVTYAEHEQPHAFRVRQIGTGERYGLVTFRGRWEWDGSVIGPVAASEPPGRRVSDFEGSRLGPRDGDHRWGTGEVRVVDVSFVDGTGRRRGVFEEFEPWMVRLRYRACRKIEEPVFGLAIHRSDGVHICGPNSHFDGVDIPAIADEGEVHYAVDSLPLTEGMYYVSASAHNRPDTVMYDYHDRLHVFRVCRVNPVPGRGLVSLVGEWTWARGDAA